MPICPRCKEEIDKLRFVGQATIIQTLYLNNITPNYDEKDRIFHEKGKEYCCPRCYEIISLSEEEAIEFLKGKKR